MLKTKEKKQKETKSIVFELLAAICALVTGLGLPVAVVAGCVVLCKMAFGG